MARSAGGSTDVAHAANSSSGVASDKGSRGDGSSPIFKPTPVGRTAVGASGSTSVAHAASSSSNSGGAPYEGSGGSGSFIVKPTHAGPTATGAGGSTAVAHAASNSSNAA